MKQFISILFLSCIVFLQGCVGGMQTSNIGTVEKVVYVTNEQKNDLYVKANNWMVDTFNNAESVIQFTDKESGSITGRYLLGVPLQPSKYGDGIKAYATIKIQVKDGAGRIMITPEEFNYFTGNILATYSDAEARADIDSLVNSFEKAMTIAANDKW